MMLQDGMYLFHRDPVELSLLGLEGMGKENFFEPKPRIRRTLNLQSI